MAGAQTLLGLYLLEHGRFDEARAPLQAACAAGEWLACQVASALPAPGLRAEDLPGAMPGLYPALPTAPVLAMGGGRVRGGKGICAIDDRGCVGELVGNADPLVLVEPATTAGEIFTLLRALPVAAGRPALWLAGWDGTHLLSRQIVLDLDAVEALDKGGGADAVALKDTAVLAAGSAASELLILKPERPSLWFAIRPEGAAASKGRR